MERCSKCGVSEEVTEFFNVISRRGIIKLCKTCLFEEQLPVIKKPRFFDEKAKEEKVDTFPKEEVSLKEIVNRNFKEKLEKGKQRQDLVHNFHWVLMRVRRLKKLSQKQLAEKIKEPEEAIIKAEKGIILDSCPRLVEKLENFFGIRIKKRDTYNEFVKGSSYYKKYPETEISFDSIDPKKLTISDLKKHSDKPVPYWRNKLVRKKEVKEDNSKAKGNIEEDREEK